MTDDNANRYVNPVILARAKELRHPMTPHEAKLWQRLRGKQFCAIKFRRQHPIYRFILDFFCYQHRLVIEIDGDSHAAPDQQLYDQARTEWLEQRGLRVIRFTNRDIDADIEGVLREIVRQCDIQDQSSPQRGELEEGETLA
jgi:very-short-patch-repair endonuclease